MRRRRAWILLTPVLITVGCGSGDRVDGQGPVTDPLPFLAERPALPREWIERGSPQRIAWRRSPRGGRVGLRWCESEASGFREWSDGGTPHTYPDVDQSVCVFPEEGDARDAYASLSLFEVGGENWPNFERASSATTAPADVSDLDDLAADEWEIGCGIGDPEGVCAVWVFRARYGTILTDVEFATSEGGITFSAMSDLIRSIDRHVAARSS